jgi:hypothetical protein
MLVPNLVRARVSSLRAHMPAHRVILAGYLCMVRGACGAREMSFNVALTGAFAAAKAISVTSDNIANAGTNAFKARNLTLGQTAALCRLARSRMSLGYPQ